MTSFDTLNSSYGEYDEDDVLDAIEYADLDDDDDDDDEAENFYEDDDDDDDDEAAELFGFGKKRKRRSKRRGRAASIATGLRMSRKNSARINRNAVAIKKINRRIGSVASGVSANRRLSRGNSKRLRKISKDMESSQMMNMLMGLINDETTYEVVSGTFGPGKEIKLKNKSDRLMSLLPLLMSGGGGNQSMMMAFALMGNNN